MIESTRQSPRLPTWRKLGYASGQAGNVLNDTLITGWLLYFYLPPALSEASTISLVPSTLLDFVPTMLLLSILARGFDSFWDPYVANWSDRSTHPFGRRRVFMLSSCAPLAASTALVFFPPRSAAGLDNVVFLGVVLLAYYALFSVYVAPYLALLPELAPDPRENVVTSTMQAVGALLGAMLVLNGGAVLIGHLAQGNGPTATHVATPAAALILAAISFVLMAIPVAVIDERKYAHHEAGPKSTLSFVASISATLRDRAFLPYVLGSTLFFFGFNIVRSALPYYVEILMGQPIEFQNAVSGAMFGVAFATFPIVGWLSGKVGKRPVMIFGAVWLGLLMAGLGLTQGPAFGLVILAAAGISIAILLAVPNAILSDVCNANALRTGERREAMFFGAQGLFQKVNLGLSTGLLALLLDVIGRSSENPWGVRWSGPLAAVALLGSAVCFWLYPERRILEELGRPQGSNTTSV
jgi:glycoside/pentoside/hexuronide:cation symporter, GPH family